MSCRYHLSSYALAAVTLCAIVIAYGCFPNLIEPYRGANDPTDTPGGLSQESLADHQRLGLLIQEPSERTALRPDISNSFRHSSQRDSFFVLRGFREAIGDAWKCTVELVVDDRQVALGAIVDADGWVITKASQLPTDAKLICRLFDGRESKVKLVSTSEDNDLALLRIGFKQLPVVSWSAPGTPVRGKWVATTYLNPTPAAVGVVSAGVQSVHPEKPILGVSLEDSSQGASITRVLLGSGADQAGLRVGDNIDSLDGTLLGNKKAVMAKIERCKAGQNLLIGFRRGEKKMQVTARLMDLADELLDPTELEVNGSISARRTGFSKVFPHDTVLSPNQCGGPLVDLDGKVVGINIARAGRVTSYALPVDVVQPVVDQMIARAKSGSAEKK